MATFESFRPQLKPGIMQPEGSKIVYETKGEFNQVIFPIGLSDLLVLCNGQLTMREIIEQLYKKNGTVHFRNIFKAIIHLKEQHVLENGRELDAHISRFEPTTSQSFFSLKPMSELSLGQRIYNDRSYPMLFYVTAMALIIAAIFSLEKFTSIEINKDFFLVDKSHLTALVYFFVGSSVMISIKNLLKCILLLFLTGRAYNFKLVYNGFSLYFRVGTDSLFLVSNHLYSTLFHVSLALSYFVIAAAFQYFYPFSPFVNQMMIMAVALFILDLNPYQESEFSRFLQTLYDDESLARLTSYFKSKSLLSVISPIERNREKSIYLFVSYFAIGWSALTLVLIYKLLMPSFESLFGAMQYLPIQEKLSAAFFITTMLAVFSLITINFTKTLLLSLFTPITRWFQIYLRNKKSEKVSEYSKEHLVETLGDLPLFSYFSTELLNMIIERSEVVKFKAGTNVIVEGDIGKNIFVLFHGIMHVKKRKSSESQTVAEIHPISIFGEIAAIEDCPRTAGVVAQEDSIVLCVPAKIIRQAAKQSQYIREIHGFRNAIMVNQYFTSAPLFRDLPDEAVHLFTTRGKIENITTGQVIFNQGTHGDSFYLIIRGAVGVNVNGKDVNKIQQGGFFGEISVIADVPRTATIFALEPTMVLKIHADAFWDILAQNIEMALFIEAVGEMRIKEDIELLSKAEKATS